MILRRFWPTTDIVSPIQFKMHTFWLVISHRFLSSTDVVHVHITLVQNQCDSSKTFYVAFICVGLGTDVECPLEPT